MLVEPISGGNRRVWVSSEEMEVCGVDADLTEHTRGGMRRLVRQALERLDEHPAGRTAGGFPGRLTVEILPVDGGCVMLVTAGLSVRFPEQLRLYRVGDLQALYALGEQWEKIGLPRLTGALYEREDGYDLAVYPPSDSLPDRRANDLLIEYARPEGAGEAAVAYVAERGKLLAVGDLWARLGIRVNVPLLPAPGDRSH